MSLTIHNASFRFYDLPYTYAIHEAATVEELFPLISAPNFGGASIITLYKVEIMKYCSSISEHAKNCGAKGHVGVLEQRAEKLSNKDLKTALVIGAGGASRAALYPLHQFGCDTIYLSNRTRATAEKIAQSFASLFKIIVIGSLEEFAARGRTAPDILVAPDILIGTIPADKAILDSFPRSLFAKSEGVCVNMPYNPRYTPLLAATDKYGEGRWGTASGIDVLLQQAFTQFWMFTGKKAPREVMWEVVRKADAEKEVSKK